MNKKYTLIFSNGVFLNQVKRYIVTSISALNEINIDQISPGSKAYVEENSTWYILKNTKEWEPLNS